MVFQGRAVKLQGCVPSFEPFGFFLPIHSVDGRNLANQLIDSLTHHLQAFIHSRWFSRRISSTVSLKSQHPNLQSLNPLPCPEASDVASMSPSDENYPSFHRIPSIA